MFASVRRIMRPVGVFSVGWETEMNGRSYSDSSRSISAWMDQPPRRLPASAVK
jgi:hypothetical protein